MSSKFLSVALATSFGYVDINNDINTDTRPLPFPIYFQPLPDIVTNEWRPLPPLGEAPALEESSPPSSYLPSKAIYSIVSKLSACFARRRKTCKERQKRLGATYDSTTDERSSGGSRDEEPQRAARLEDTREGAVEMNRGEYWRNIGTSLRNIADGFRGAQVPTAFMTPTTTVQFSVCLTVALFVSAFAIRFFRS